MVEERKCKLRLDGFYKYAMSLAVLNVHKTYLILILKKGRKNYFLSSFALISPDTINTFRCVNLHFNIFVFLVW